MNQMQIISPTKNKIRLQDDLGSGLFNAPRGGKEKHNGLDFLCNPGQEVIAPIDGVIKRKAFPYTDKTYSGLLLENDSLAMKLFYLEPDIGIIGKKVSQGQRIGIAQDISKRYNKGKLKMQPHIHLEIERIDPMLLLTS